MIRSTFGKWAAPLGNIFGSPLYAPGCARWIRNCSDSGPQRRFLRSRPYNRPPPFRRIRWKRFPTGDKAYGSLIAFSNPPPAWFDEGFSAYFEGLEFDEHRNLLTDCSDLSELSRMKSGRSMSRQAWERFFDEQYLEIHAEIPDSTQGGKIVTELITEKMLKKIRKFAVNGAADSEQPMTCD